MGLCPFAVCAALVLPVLTRAQERLTYRLQYLEPDGSANVHVAVTFEGGRSAPVTMIMPRSFPGGYGLRPYDHFVENVHGFGHGAKQQALGVVRDAAGPRWVIGRAGENVARIEYEVNIAQMENEILSSVDSSHVRRGYVGLLGYSIFSFIDGMEDAPIQLEIESAPRWPVFTTLDPRAPAAVGRVEANASNYYALADSQIIMGPNFTLRELAGKMPIFMAVYAETKEGVEEDGKLAREALDRVANYFGESPIDRYTVHIELLNPISPRNRYTLSQEHYDSGSFTLDVSRAITPNSTEAQREVNRFNYAHHMAHAWVPKRTYGVGYMPFQWEQPPIIETIWFNEGFARYTSIAALAAAMPAAEGARYRKEKLDTLRGFLERTPGFIRRMSTVDVSRAGSFLYTEDPRLAQNLYSRGALLASEIDDRIRERTGGKKDFGDALRAALAWTRENHRGFRVEELAGIIEQGTGVNVRDIIERWLAPLDG